MEKQLWVKFVGRVSSCVKPKWTTTGLFWSSYPCVPLCTCQQWSRASQSEPSWCPTFQCSGSVCRWHATESSSSRPYGAYSFSSVHVCVSFPFLLKCASPPPLVLSPGVPLPCLSTAIKSSHVQCLCLAVWGWCRICSLQWVMRWLASSVLSSHWFN